MVASTQFCLFFSMLLGRKRLMKMTSSPRRANTSKTKW